MYPHYDFPEIRPLSRQKNKTNFINWAAPQAAELISACSRSFSWLVNFRDFFYTAWSKVFRKALLSLMKEQVPRLAKSASRQYFTVFRLILASRWNTDLGGTRVAQWWEHSPPTNVARVQIPASTPYVSWVCCWFSPLLREVFLRLLRFSPLLKNQLFQIPIRPGIR